MNEIKNSGNCDNSFAFAANAVQEAAYRISKGIKNDLSEQELIDCAPGTGTQCREGQVYQAWDYVKQVGGLSQSQDYKYNVVQGTCKNNTAKVQPIQGYYKILNTTNAVKLAVDSRPVAATIKVSNAFRYYKTGIPSTCI